MMMITGTSRIMAVKQHQASTTLSTFTDAKSKQNPKSTSSNENHHHNKASKVKRNKEENKNTIRVVRLRQNESANSKLGFSLRGGKEVTGSSVGVFVSHVEPFGEADKKGLMPGDQLMEVNGLDVNKATYDEVIALIKRTPSRREISLKVNNLGKIPFQEKSGDPIKWLYVDINNSITMEDDNSLHDNNNNNNNNINIKEPLSSGSSDEGIKSCESSNSSSHLYSSSDFSSRNTNEDDCFCSTTSSSSSLGASSNSVSVSTCSISISSDRSISLQEEDESINLKESERNCNSNSTNTIIRVPGGRKTNEPFGCGVVKGLDEWPGIFVQNVKPGSLAERVGLEMGDQLIEADEHLLLNLSFEFAIKLIKQLQFEQDELILKVRKGAALKYLAATNKQLKLKQHQQESDRREEERTSEKWKNCCLNNNNIDEPRERQSAKMRLNSREQVEHYEQVAEAKSQQTTKTIRQEANNNKNSGSDKLISGIKSQLSGTTMKENKKANATVVSLKKNNNHQQESTIMSSDLAAPSKLQPKKEEHEEVEAPGEVLVAGKEDQEEEEEENRIKNWRSSKLVNNSIQISKQQQVTKRISPTSSESLRLLNSRSKDDNISVKVERSQAPAPISRPSQAAAAKVPIGDVDLISKTKPRVLISSSSKLTPVSLHGDAGAGSCLCDGCSKADHTGDDNNNNNGNCSNHADLNPDDNDDGGDEQRYRSRCKGMRREEEEREESCQEQDYSQSNRAINIIKPRMMSKSNAQATRNNRCLIESNQVVGDQVEENDGQLEQKEEEEEEIRIVNQNCRLHNHPSHNGSKLNKLIINHRQAPQVVSLVAPKAPPRLPPARKLQQQQQHQQQKKPSEIHQESDHQYLLNQQKCNQITCQQETFDTADYNNNNEIKTRQQQLEHQPRSTGLINQQQERRQMKQKLVNQNYISMDNLSICTAIENNKRRFISSSTNLQQQQQQQNQFKPIELPVYAVAADYHHQQKPLDYYNTYEGLQQASRMQRLYRRSNSVLGGLNNIGNSADCCMSATSGFPKNHSLLKYHPQEMLSKNNRPCLLLNKCQNNCTTRQQHPQIYQSVNHQQQKQILMQQQQNLTNGCRYSNTIVGATSGCSLLRSRALSMDKLNMNINLNYVKLGLSRTALRINHRPNTTTPVASANASLINQSSKQRRMRVGPQQQQQQPSGHLLSVNPCCGSQGASFDCLKSGNCNVSHISCTPSNSINTNNVLLVRQQQANVYNYATASGIITGTGNVSALDGSPKNNSKSSCCCATNTCCDQQQQLLNMNKTSKSRVAYSQLCRQATPIPSNIIIKQNTTAPAAAALTTNKQGVVPPLVIGATSYSCCSLIHQASAASHPVAPPPPPPPPSSSCCSLSSPMSMKHQHYLMDNNKKIIYQTSSGQSKMMSQQNKMSSGKYRSSKTNSNSDGGTTTDSSGYLSANEQQHYHQHHQCSHQAPLLKMCNIPAAPPQPPTPRRHQQVAYNDANKANQREVGQRTMTTFSSSSICTTNNNNRKKHELISKSTIGAVGGKHISQKTQATSGGNSSSDSIDISPQGYSSSSYDSLSPNSSNSISIGNNPNQTASDSSSLDCSRPQASPASTFEGDFSNSSGKLPLQRQQKLIVASNKAPPPCPPPMPVSASDSLELDSEEFDLRVSGKSMIKKKTTITGNGIRSLTSTRTSTTTTARTTTTTTLNKPSLCFVDELKMFANRQSIEASKEKDLSQSDNDDDDGAENEEDDEDEDGREDRNGQEGSGKSAKKFKKRKSGKEEPVDSSTLIKIINASKSAAKAKTNSTTIRCSCRNNNNACKSASSSTGICNSAQHQSSLSGANNKQQHLGKTKSLHDSSIKLNEEDNKRRQHEMLMKEFKSAHSKMFSKRRATEEAAAAAANNNSNTTTVAGLPDQDAENQDHEHENKSNT